MHDNMNTPNKAGTLKIVKKFYVMCIYHSKKKLEKKVKRCFWKKNRDKENRKFPMFLRYKSSVLTVGSKGPALPAPTHTPALQPQFPQSSLTYHAPAILKFWLFPAPTATETWSSMFCCLECTWVLLHVTCPYPIPTCHIA